MPGYGAAGGFSLRLLDKTNEHRLPGVRPRSTASSWTTLRKRKELTGLFTFFAANYPQYELVIDNAAGDAEGRLHRQGAWTTSTSSIGSTYEQGFIRFGHFFKVYVQAAPEFRRLPSDILNLYVKNDRERDGAVLGVHDA